MTLLTIDEEVGIFVCISKFITFCIKWYTIE